jgi:benzoyl-CoA reductase subunit C
VKPEEIIRQFRSTVADPFGYARKLKESKNCPVVGHTCTYFPEEIVLAAGAHPIRLFGESVPIMKADSHIQAYSCSLVRSIFEDALSGELEFLDLMVFPHSCDTMQRLSDIWRLNVKNMVHLDMLFPVHLKSEAAKEYLKAVIERFRLELGKALNVEITEKTVSEAIFLMNRIRSALHALYEIRSQTPERISGSDLNHLVRGSMMMDRHEAVVLLEQLVTALRQIQPSTVDSSMKRILLSGGVCLQPDLHDIVEEQGGAVVWDDLCTGSRYFDTPVSEELVPTDAIADRFIDRAICPAKHSGITRRTEDLLQLTSKYKIDGVIFLFLKFCDPHGFDYPDLKIALEEVGIPSLFLEVETGKPVDGPTRTRVETFLQILNQGTSSS